MSAIALGSHAIRMLLAGETIPIKPQLPGIYWVREMIRVAEKGPRRWVYSAGGDAVEVPQDRIGDVIQWSRAQKRAHRPCRVPASHMPRMFSRFTIEVHEGLAAIVYRQNIDQLVQ